ncbi:MAG: hypothetical protein WD063_08910 [Pirellulales bacterium]
MHSLAGGSVTAPLESVLKTSSLGFDSERTANRLPGESSTALERLPILPAWNLSPFLPRKTRYLRVLGFAKKLEYHGEPNKVQIPRENPHFSTRATQNPTQLATETASMAACSK